MANTKLSKSLFLVFLALILAPYTSQESRLRVALAYQQAEEFSGWHKETHMQVGREGRMMSSRRLMIGSTAPTCTYNECRGCKYKCRAEQVPVEGNDPMNSPYHYRCICHR